MTGMLAAGLIAGIVASVLFNLGIALQAIEARRAPREEGLRVSLIWSLLHRRLWVAGLGVEWLGVPLEILAFAWAPFVVVQPLLACGLLVLLAVARRLLDEVPTTEALVGVGLIIAGTCLIAWGAPGEQDTHRGAVAVIGVVAGLVLASFIPFALRGRRLDTAITAVLGSACGFAATNVAMKLMADDLGNDHWPQAAAWLAVAAVAGFGATVTGMTALQRARATTVIPISTAVPTLSPGGARAALPPGELPRRRSRRAAAAGRPGGDAGRDRRPRPHPVGQRDRRGDEPDRGRPRTIAAMTYSLRRLRSRHRGLRGRRPVTLVLGRRPGHLGRARRRRGGDPGQRRGRLRTPRGLGRMAAGASARRPWSSWSPPTNWPRCARSRWSTPSAASPPTPAPTACRSRARRSGTITRRRAT